MSEKTPKFGDRMYGTFAAEGNPIKYGIFVRVVNRTGRVNRGVYYELTNGKGRFWQYPKDAVAFCPPEGEEPPR